MTMTHSKQSIQQSIVAWPYKRDRRERRGHDRAKKSVHAGAACSVGKVCTDTLLTTVCSTSNTKRKKNKGMKSTQAAAGTNYLNVSRWNPWILCNASKWSGWIQEEPRRQPDSRRKCVASTVALQSVLIAFHLSLRQDWWYSFSASRVFIGVVFPHIVLLVNPSRCS